MEKPTVGRKVWVWNAPGVVRDMTQPFDGSICLVHDDALVDVSYVTHGGTLLVAERVPLSDAKLGGVNRHGVTDQHASGAPYATWMPYQMKQAAKAGQHPALAAASAIDLGPVGENTAP